MFRIEGYRVLVTASTKGIGKGIAKVLLQAGATVTVSSRSRENVERAVNELSKLGTVYGFVADLTKRGDVEALVQKAAEAMGGIDSLVYVTGPPRPGMFSEISEEDWDYGIRLLIKSAIWVTKEALPYIRSSGRGSIVYVTSVAVKEPIPNIVLSNTLRIAVHGLAKSLSRELAPHVRVNAVLPGHIMTDRAIQLAEDLAKRTGKTPDEILAERAATIPMKRLGKPEDVGYLVAFLISPYASYITGASIPVDGGLLTSVF